MEATPEPMPAQDTGGLPPWLLGVQQFAMLQFLRAMAEREQNRGRVPSWQMPYPMPATQGERDVLGMLPVAGDVEDVRYLMEGMHEGDPAKAAMGGAAALMPFVPTSLLHTVYHGSPHIFDAFKMSKIGTGEGAQAYGHGLYFAESPGVAKSYQTQLAGNTAYKGQPISELPRNQQIAALDLATLQQQVGDKGKALRYRLEEVGGYVQNTRKNLDEAIEKLGTIEDTGEDWGSLRYFEWTPQVVEEQRQALRNVQDQYDFLRSLDPEDVGQSPGALYKVEIPDEAVGRMLDWDKPLSEQPESVREVIESKLNPNENMFFDGERWIPFDDMHKTGRSLYEAISRFHGQEVASDILRQAGIPGIRYLDQMSRGAEEGTRNLVLFDESLAKILERK